MDRPISRLEQRKNKLGGVFRIVLILLLLVAGFFGLRYFLTTKATLTDFRIATVEKGNIENAITATGTIVPAFEQQINAPIGTVIQEVLLLSGDKVKSNDLLMQLDPEYIQLQYESLGDQLELKKSNITRLELEYDKNLHELEYNDQIKALEMSSKKALLADARRLKEIGSATQEEVEKAELDLQIIELEKKKLENQLQFSKKVLGTDQRKLELEVLIQEKKLKELQRKLRETTVRAPQNGVITWINEEIGKKVNEGDPLVRIANLDRFRIEASCSDRYANLVKIGMPVKVRINNQRIDGKVSSILPAVENNTVEFVVQLQQQDHPDLRPNMRVEVFIISDEKENVLRVANGPAFTGGIQQEVFVIRNTQAIKEKIKVGLVSPNYIEIVDNTLQAGDRVIISDMKKYAHLGQIELK